MIIGTQVAGVYASDLQVKRKTYDINSKSSQTLQTHLNTKEEPALKQLRYTLWHANLGPSTDELIKELLTPYFPLA